MGQQMRATLITASYISSYSMAAQAVDCNHRLTAGGNYPNELIGDTHTHSLLDTDIQ